MTLVAKLFFFVGVDALVGLAIIGVAAKVSIFITTVGGKVGFFLAGVGDKVRVVIEKAWAIVAFANVVVGDKIIIAGVDKIAAFFQGLVAGDKGFYFFLLIYFFFLSFFLSYFFDCWIPFINLWLFWSSSNVKLLEFKFSWRTISRWSFSMVWGICKWWWEIDGGAAALS